ncbi:MAG: TIGR03792 family protein [Clostridiales bacterium]|nr:TIGR03792 family protein [Clostridiales bacterium]
MELKVYDKPLFIEGLTFRMPVEKVEEYLRIEKEIWFEDLCTLPGFVGGETWVSEDNPGEVTCLYFWESEEAYKSIDPEFSKDHKDRTNQAIDTEFICAWHGENKRFKVREFHK